MSESAKIRSVKVRAVVAPLRRPVRTAVGAIPAAPLALIDVARNDGVVGSAYIFAYTTTALPALARLLADIGAEIVEKAAVPLDLYRHFDRRFRLLGWQGLVGMAVSGIDMALWDAHAKSLGLAVTEALGTSARPIPAYDSYGMIDPKADAPALEASLAAGFRAIKIKLGDGDLALDLTTLREVRAIIGTDISLMVDYNQCLDPVEAMRRVEAIGAFDLTWIEEPVKAEDLDGHARVRAVSPAPIQTGENWWFQEGARAAIAAGASDHAMLDLMKIGGVTGWLQAAALCEAAGLPVSSHLFQEASAHVLAATAGARWLECLDLAGDLVLDPIRLVDGTVAARGPGLGLAWNETVVARLAI